MNHLHEVLQERIYGVESLTRHDMDRAFADFPRFAERAVCFWMGHDEDEPPTRKVLPELASLPYDDCWFELSRPHPDGGGSIVYWALCLMKRGGRLQMLLMIKLGGTWRLQAFGEWNEWSSHDYGRDPDFSAPATRGPKLAGNLLRVGQFLSAMNCKNVQRSLVTPSAKLQKARLKRGKKPLFSYWTLHLTGRTEPGDPQGGTHASPRVHLRRGHPREFAPGKFTWVQPAVVGNKALGMVHKDYAAGTDKDGAA